MQRSTARGRSAAQILGGAFVVTAELDHAELHLDLAVETGAADPTSLVLTSRSIDRSPDGSLRFSMSGAVTVDGTEIATEMVLRDCGVSGFGADALALVSGTTVSSSRRRPRDSMSIDLLLVPATDHAALRADAA
jgi:hypothetical protein